MSDLGTEWSAGFAQASADSMRIYERTTGRMFIPFAHDIVDRLAPAPGAHVLDIACGPGTVARLLAARVGPEGRVFATDISAGMIDVARADSPPDDVIEWMVAPATDTSLPDASLNGITCQQGLQFFPDKVAALAEMRRVLGDGRALISVWTPVEEQGIFSILWDAMCATLPREVADRYLGPYALSGEDAAQHARDAGFEQVSVERITLETHLDGGTDALVDSLAGTGFAADFAALDADARAALYADVARRGAGMIKDGALHGTLTTALLTLS